MTLPAPIPQGDAVPLQRLADAAAGPDAAPGAAGAPLREIVFPTPATAGYPTAANPAPGPGAGTASFAGTGPALSAGQGAPAMPVQRAGATAGRSSMAGRPADAATPAPLALAHPPIGQTHVAVQASAAPTASRITGNASAPAIQTSASIPAAAGTATSLPTFTATPVVQRVEGSAPSAPTTTEHTDSELDDLARALFGRIRNHLRTEVIQEREAKGLTFDAF